MNLQRHFAIVAICAALGACASTPPVAESTRLSAIEYGNIATIAARPVAVIDNQAAPVLAPASGPLYHISIRTDNGSERSVTQASIENLRVGDRVRIIDEHAYRY